uniref:Uncharacterized protein n=1 Tax=Echeneis naucrates TaxID=173247 RepID=A0A665UJB1_ECHNA
VQYFIAWFSSRSSSTTVLSLGSADLDWEVKVHTLELAEKRTEVLLSGLVDCDRPVSLKACQLLIKFRETVCPVSIEAPEETVAEVSCELPGWGWGQDIMCEVLRSLGLDAKLDILIQSSDHVHNSPLSLLQDILTAGAAHSHPDTQPGQEVIVDCY